MVNNTVSSTPAISYHICFFIKKNKSECKQKDRYLKLTWVFGKFLVTTISHIYTNKQVFKNMNLCWWQWSYQCAVISTKNTHSPALFWHEHAFLLACKMRCYRRALISDALFSMSLLLLLPWNDWLMGGVEREWKWKWRYSCWSLTLNTNLQGNKAV